ncbi:MAG: phosphate acyltransferase PlsX [Nitrospiraceae bacterium]|nr:MAG: phosphate acyltransferase PlsX [Nitrospiraceae bacterium]
MRIALDAMGGDFAPSATVEGALEALAEEKDLSVILVGNEDQIKAELEKKGRNNLPVSVHHASQLVEMDESPLAALRRKKDSSIRVAIDLVKSGGADAMVSAGNSGVVMATALYVLGKIPGVDRPAIATTMPSLTGHFVLLDAGANVDCKPLHLYQFAVMGEAYARFIFNIPKPRVGLLGIGEEDVKGNELTKLAFKLIRESHVKFIGNIEGQDIFSGEADVVVCDGFVGNIALKVSEGLAETIGKMLRTEIVEKVVASDKTDTAVFKSAFAGFKKKMDYSEYGGAPLLGISRPCIISHGRSTSKAIKNAIRVAGVFHSKGVLDIIAEELKEGLSGREAVALEE